jgi:hypothetical protein
LSEKNRLGQDCPKDNCFECRNLSLRTAGDLKFVIKTLALSVMLAVGTMAMACDTAGNKANVAHTANSANGNRTTNMASNANMTAVNAHQMAANANNEGRKCKPDGERQ